MIERAEAAPTEGEQQTVNYQLQRSAKTSLKNGATGIMLILTHSKVIKGSLSCRICQVFFFFMYLMKVRGCGDDPLDSAHPTSLRSEFGFPSTHIKAGHAACNPGMGVGVGAQEDPGAQWQPV